MKKITKITMMLFVMVITVFMASCESFTNNKSDSKETTKEAIKETTKEVVLKTEDASSKYPTITKTGVAPFFLDASFLNIPPQGDYYDNIVLNRFYTISIGDHVTDITEAELNEYYEEFGSDFFDVFDSYGTGVVKQGNDTILIATYDKDGIIYEIEIYSEKLCLENGIHVGMSSETMASKYNASFLTTDYFAGEAWMSYNVNELPINIILWATNNYDIFDDDQGMNPTSGELINDNDCFFRYKVPMDKVKDSRVASICIKRKEFKSFHPRKY